MQVIGLCRFSYVGSGGYKREHGSLDARRAYLYAPERMEERFRLFETICLPSIIGQTDQGFQMAIVIGECMPAPYVERLLALTDPLPNVAVIAREPGKHRRIMSGTLNNIREDLDAPCIQFRLDDDDAMGCTFVEQIKQIAEDTNALWQRHDMTTVDFNCGYIYRADADGLSIRADRYPYTAIAMGVIVRAGATQSIMHHGHHRLWQHTPTLTVPDGRMYLRGYNGFNDSRSKGRGRKISVSPVTQQQAAELKQLFNVDNDQVARAFSGL